jgi:ABC-2 type transport system ATP-binding protein
MTTDTTEAERAPRKSDPATSSGGAVVSSAVVASAAAAATAPKAAPPAEPPVVEAEPPAVEPGAAPAGADVPPVEQDAAPTEVRPAEQIAPPAEPEAPSVAQPETPADATVEQREAPTDAAPTSVETPAEPAATPTVEEPRAQEPETVAPATEETDRAVGDERGVAVIPVAPAPVAAPRKKRTLRVARPAPAAAARVLAIEGLVKRYGDTTAVDAISLDVQAGSFYGIVGPNGAGKTTTLSMVTGLLRPDAGTVRINDVDVWKDPGAAKRATGVLPDRLRLFDRLTGSELLYYSGSLRGLDHRTVLDRSADLAAAFGLEDALDRLVADYSAGMTKKIALACAMIHSPRLLVLDEPFESVDPVSAANLTDILERYVAGGGTVLLSSHSMDLIERVCDSAAIIVGGRVLASGALDEVRQGQTLEDRFVELAGGRKAAEGLEWLHSFSD